MEIYSDLLLLYATYASPVVLIMLIFFLCRHIYVVRPAASSRYQKREMNVREQSKWVSLRQLWRFTYLFMKKPTKEMDKQDDGEERPFLQAGSCL
ncbi:hypothetical protein J2S09_003020 [Bacillus fengqiuensis]|nr:hypothetical protein [Bacillus fengqiuensis]